MYIIGVNFSHDYSACLLKDGDIRVAIALERLVRIRRGIVPTHQLPPALHSLVRYCVDAEGITLDDVDGFIGSTTETRNQHEEQVLIPSIFLLPDRKVFSLPHPGHHLAHALASFHTSGFERAAALVVDGYGSIVDHRRESASAFAMSNHEPPRLVYREYKPATRIAGMPRGERLVLPDSLDGIGEMYHVISLVLGFRQHGTYYDDAGKTMGLASYGSRLSHDPVFIRVTENGLDYSNALPFLASHNLISHELGANYLNVRPPNVPLSQFHCDLAAQVQWEVEEACLYLARRLRRETGLNNLVLGGGVFLNSVANSRIIRESGFEQVFIFPAATDDGTAVGAAYYARFVAMNGSAVRAPKIVSAALGRVYSSACVQSAIDRYPLEYADGETPMHVARESAAALAQGKIVGWFQGGAEFGPRALGNRSILANPQLQDIQATLNGRVKFREAFRPFAPAVLEERADDYFELDGQSSPFMLQICAVRPKARDLLPGITHVDGTARVQTVSRHANPLLYALIEEFGRLTGVPVVLNTSFNLRGMPIVETPEDALTCFMSTEMDYLAIDRFLVSAPDFGSLVPVRENLELSITGTWQADIARWSLTRALRIAFRQESSGGPGHERELSADQLQVLEAVDGGKTVREIASQLGRPLASLTREILALHRDRLLYWRPLASAEPVTRTPVVDVRPAPYSEAAL